MKVQGVRSAALSINSRSANHGGQSADTVGESAAQTAGAATATAIRSLKQLEFAEINGKKVTIGEEQLVRAIERAIREISGPDTALEVKIHESTGSVVMRVINRETGDLIREVPPERTLDIVYKMMEIAGLLFDEKV